MKEKLILEFIKIMNFYSLKDLRMKTQAIGRKCLKTAYQIRTCIKIYKELLKTNNKKTNNPVLKKLSEQKPH